MDQSVRNSHVERALKTLQQKYEQSQEFNRSIRKAGAFAVGACTTFFSLLAANLDFEKASSFDGPSTLATLGDTGAAR